MIVNVYTDASYCDKTKIAACGFTVYSEGKMIKHSIVMMENVKNNNVAEAIAATEGISYCFLLDGVGLIYLHTDCLGIKDCKVPNKKGTRKPIYIREFVEIIDIINEYNVKVHVQFVKGHGSNQRHSFIDISVRRHLRHYLKPKKIKSNETISVKENIPYKERHPVTYYRGGDRV